MYLIVRGVLQYAPIGVFALIAVVFGSQGAKAFGPLGTVTFAAFLGYILHVVIVYGSDSDDLQGQSHYTFSRMQELP